MLRTDDDMTQDMLAAFEQRSYATSEAGRYENDQARLGADAERTRNEDDARAWIKGLGMGDTIPSHDDYDYAAMLGDGVYPKPDQQGRLPLPPRYYKPGRLIMGGIDVATGKRVLSRVPLEDRIMGMADDGDGPDTENPLDQASETDWAELSPQERNSLEAWMESVRERPEWFTSQGVIVADSGNAGTLTEAPLAGYGEAAASMGSAILGSIPAGLAGLAELARGNGMDEAVKTIEAVQEWLTVLPKTEEGQRALQQLGSLMEKLSVPSEKVGNAVMDATGSPTLATGAEIVLDPLNMLPAGGMAVKAAAKGAKLSTKSVLGAAAIAAGLSGDDAEAAGAAESLPQNADKTADEVKR